MNFERFAVAVIGVIGKLRPYAGIPTITVVLYDSKIDGEFVVSHFVGSHFATRFKTTQTAKRKLNFKTNRIRWKRKTRGRV